jgi:RHS repeat-associated protein
VELPLAGFSRDDLVIPSDDGAEIYVFDRNGRHLRTLDALTGAMRYQLSYDSAGHLVALTDGDGHTTTIARDASGNPATIIAPFGQRTTLRLDAHGYLANVTDPAGHSTQLTYTADGLLIDMAPPRGNRQRFTYDPQGRLIRDEDPAGGFKTLTRHALPSGFEVTLATALGRTTSHRVEEFPTGERRRINTFPSGLREEHRMGGDGRRITTLPDGTVQSLLLGPEPRFGMQSPLAAHIQVKTPYGLESNVTSARTITLADPHSPLTLLTQTDVLTLNGNAYTSTFEATLGRLTHRTPAGRQSVTLLDGQGRVVEVQRDGFSPLRYTYDARGRLTAIAQGPRTAALSYDAQGYLAAITDSLARSVSFEYDSAGRLTRQALSDGREILYAYDANGNVTSITPPGRPSHALTYTPVDLETAYVPPELDVGPTPTQYAYNLDRQLVQVTRPDGITLDLGYDGAGRLSTLTFPQGQLGFGYHPSTGNLATLTAPDGGTLTYDYDGSLLTSEAWSGHVAGRVQYTYDNDFRVIAQQLNGEVLATFQYDADGLLTQAGALTLSRDPRHGLLTGSALGQITDTWAYTSVGELDSYRARFGGTEILAVQYERDALGRIVQKAETLDGQTTTYTYAYDLAGRLTTVTRNGRPIATYAYDSNGNRVSYTSPDGTTTGTYDAQDRLTQYGSTAYTYTANGELQSKTTGGQTTTYTYDALGNLTAVTLPDGTPIEYVIDGRNRRIGKKVNGALVQGFLYSGQLRPVAELDGNGAIAARFIYGSRGNVPDYLIKGGYTYRILTDHLGSPRLVVEIATGHIVQRLAYDAFGRVTFDDNPGFQPFGFAGGLYDPDTQLTRFGARDYDAETGRWTAKDPIRFLGGDPNLYGYVLNDPVNRVDFLGLTDIGAEAAYGETAGLFPQLVQGNNVYNPRIWDSSSYAELQLARQWIADVRERNAYTNRARPRNLRNPIEQRIWQDCQRAAEAAENFDLPNDVKHFFLRQDGVGRQTPAWASNTRPYRSFGPFINVGGGDVPKGSATYIDFYRGIR